MQVNQAIGKLDASEASAYKLQKGLQALVCKLILIQCELVQVACKTDCVLEHATSAFWCLEQVYSGACKLATCSFVQAFMQVDATLSNLHAREISLSFLEMEKTIHGDLRKHIFHSNH